MADASDTPVLSNKQKQFTVRAAKKKPLKAALCSPYRVVWPQVSNEDCAYVLDLLEREFGAVELRKTSWILRHDKKSEYKAFKKLKPDERKEMLSSLLNQRTSEERNLMSQLVIGFQKVNKCLERDDLRLVLVARENWQLIQHLALLAGIRRCPGMAVPGLEQCLATKLGVSKLSAIGFKKKQSGDCGKFDQMIGEIASRCPSIDIPWLELENELTSIKSSGITEEQTQYTTGEVQSCDRTLSCDLREPRSCDEKRAVHLPDKEGDKMESRSCNDFYKAKSETLKKQKIIFEEKPNNKGIDNLDFIALEDVDLEKKPKRKKKDKNFIPSKKAKFSRHSTWQPPDVGQMVANPNRKPAKRK